MPARDHRMAPSAAASRVVTALFVDERERDLPGVLIPRPEAHLVVRFGAASGGGLDAHVFGARERVHRKVIRAGLRTVTVRLRLGADEAVLGVSAPEIAGRIVPLEDLWGRARMQRLYDRLARTQSTFDGATVVESAIAERLPHACARDHRASLALEAARRLESGNVNANAVAAELGLSERHLRRIFRETLGAGPKAFAKLSRFRRAVRAADAHAAASWATIAAMSGYYDQAHLIADFRSIAGVTPRMLLDELRVAASGRAATSQLVPGLHLDRPI